MKGTEKSAIIIYDAYFDEDGKWWVEGMVDGVSFEGMAPEPTKNGFGRFDWWTDRPVSFLPPTAKQLVEALRAKYWETPPHPLMELIG